MTPREGTGGEMMRRFVGSLTLVLLAGTTNAQADPAEILARAMEHLRGGELVATIELVVTRPDRETRYVLELVADGDTAGLGRVLAPPRDAGQAFLRDGDNLFLYHPRVGRALRLPPSGRSDSFLGSDITYGDFAGRDLERDYQSRLLGEEGTTVVLELLALTGAPTPFGRVLLTLAADTLTPLEQVLEDQRGEAVRRIEFGDHVDTDGRRFPTTLIVEDLLREGHETVVRYVRFSFDTTVPASCFEQRALEVGCM
jgi:outer membrane lipoprotein-sorting protein